jgi:hypothetical protein
MSWNNTNFGRKRTRDRGKVTWIDKSGKKPAPFMQDLPSYSENFNITREIEQSLVPGTMFASLFVLGVERVRGETKNRKFQTLSRSWDVNTATILPGQFLICAGMVRIDERESNGRIVSAPKYTFIFGSGRYIINDFSLIQVV